MAAPGDKIARYVIEARLGGGGMGEVFRAFDSLLKRRIALKKLHPRATPGMDTWGAAERMLREARAAAAFMHPNVVQVFDVGDDGGLPFIAMELVEGETLRARLTSAEPWQVRVGWLLDVARALAAAHAAGLVHRDIKPENIMIRGDGVVKVLDFGIARQTSAPVDPTAATSDAALASLTAEGAIVGTPAYMAPEQIRAEPVDGRTDQFAWGVTAYELLTGRLPWRGKDAVGLGASVLTDTPPAMPGIVPALEAAVRRTLEKGAEHRFPDMAALIAVLEPIVRGEVVTAPPAVALTPAPASPARAHWPGFAVAVVALLVAGAAAFMVLRGRGGSHAGGAGGAGPAPSRDAGSRAVVAGLTAPDSGPAVMLRHICDNQTGDTACQPGFVAWCDLGERRIACCQDGLLAAGSADGLCICPLVGTLSAAAKAGGCVVPTLPAADKPSINAVIQAAEPRLRYCYEQALNQRPSATGGITIGFSLTPEGHVFSARLESSSLPDVGAQSCALRILRSLEFPPPDGGKMKINYPIDFKPVGD